MGMGIHGEPGIWRDKLRSADEIAEEMVKRLREDAVAHGSDRVSVLVNVAKNDQGVWLPVGRSALGLS